MITAYLGIDPGARGGLACIFSDGSETPLRPKDGNIYFRSMPKSNLDIYHYLNEVDHRAEVIHCVIEQVGGYMPKTDKQEDTGSSMFKFGKSYGALLMALDINLIPYREVSPSVWQRAVGLASVKDESKTAHKNRLKQLAEKLFPNLLITLATADALLLAHYAKEVHHA